MWLSTMMSVGRSVAPLATWMAAAMAPRSLASVTWTVFHPYPWNRTFTFSLNARSVLPSMVMRLLS